MNMIVFGLVLAELLAVAWIDLQTKKISNYWPLINLVVAVLLYIFMRDVYVLDWEVLIFPIGFIIIGFFLFLAHVMGAGDSKYIASLFLLVPTEYHFIFFEKLLSVTIVVGAVFLCFKIVRNFHQFRAYFLSRYWGGIKDLIKSRFSYAPVILIAWILLGVGQWK